MSLVKKLLILFMLTVATRELKGGDYVWICDPDNNCGWWWIEK